MIAIVGGSEFTYFYQHPNCHPSQALRAWSHPGLQEEDKAPGAVGASVRVGLLEVGCCFQPFKQQLQRAPKSSWGLQGVTPVQPGHCIGAPAPELRSLEGAEGIRPELSLPPSSVTQLSQGSLCMAGKEKPFHLHSRTALQGVCCLEAITNPCQPCPFKGLFPVSNVGCQAQPSCNSSSPHCRPLGATRAPRASWRDGAPWTPWPPRPSRQPGPPSKWPPRRPLLPAATYRQGQ